MLSSFAMVRQKITTHAMLELERQYWMEQEIRARNAPRAARIAAGLPPDSPEPEEDEEQQSEENEEHHQPEPTEEADQEEDEAELPE